MKIKTNVKAGNAVDGMGHNHNQKVARGLEVESAIKAAAPRPQHNQTVARGLSNFCRFS